MFIESRLVPVISVIEIILFIHLILLFYKELHLNRLLVLNYRLYVFIHFFNFNIMAIIYDNLVTTGLKGKFGDQVVFRTYKGHTVVSKKPIFNGERSDAQIKQISRFSQAASYAKSVLATDEIRQIYAEKAQNSTRQVNAYNLAIADYLHAPEIHKVDLNAYHGKLCDEILISATDDFEVNRVMIEIFRSDNSLLEVGVAQPEANNFDWIYYAQSVNDSFAGCKVVVSVTDLPGNLAVHEIVL